MKLVTAPVIELGEATGARDRGADSEPPASLLDTVARFLGDRALLVFSPLGSLAWLSPRLRAELGPDFTPAPEVLDEVRAAACLHPLASHVLRSRIAGRRVSLSSIRHAEQSLIVAELLAADSLSAAESRVLEALGRGLSNAEIAAHLDVSVATVKTHLHRIFDKLGVRSRVEAALIARGHATPSTES